MRGAKLLRAYIHPAPHQGFMYLSTDGVVGRFQYGTRAKMGVKKSRPRAVRRRVEPKGGSDIGNQR
eukprot:3883270-Prymnesium_polylepis.1